MTDTIAQGTDRAFSHTMQTTAAPDRIWRLWTDPASWKHWDRGLQDAELEGDFGLGATGRITPLTGPKAKFEVIELDPGTSYSFATAMPLARLVVTRSFVDDAPTRFRHDVAFEGAMAGLWSRLYGKRFREALPATMEALARLAEDGVEAA